jgi:hypothetical protein
MKAHTQQRGRSLPAVEYEMIDDSSGRMMMYASIAALLREAGGSAAVNPSRISSGIVLPGQRTRCPQRKLRVFF